MFYSAAFYRSFVCTLQLQMRTLGKAPTNQSDEEVGYPLYEQVCFFINDHCGLSTSEVSSVNL